MNENPSGNKLLMSTDKSFSAFLKTDQWAKKGQLISCPHEY
jgi:hypothetical protein